jgi:hypothetical protein
MRAGPVQKEQHGELPYMPDAGESMYTLHGMPDPEAIGGLFPLIADPRNSLYGDVCDEEAAEAVDQLVPQTLASFAGRITKAAWRDLPSTYLICDNDP